MPNCVVINLNVSVSECVFVFILAHNSRSVQPANQPPHWAQDSLYGSVLPANSHLPVKNLLTSLMTGKGENVWESVCVTVRMDGGGYVHDGECLIWYVLVQERLRRVWRGMCTGLRNLINYACVHIYVCVKKIKYHTNMYPLESLCTDSWEEVYIPVNQHPCCLHQLFHSHGFLDPTYSPGPPHSHRTHSALVHLQRWPELHFHDN